MGLNYVGCIDVLGEEREELFTFIMLEYSNNI